jgi:ABC-type oligopeptide transport system ATPase subunit
VPAAFLELETLETLGRTILQLIPPISGTVVLEGRHLNQLHGRELRRARAHF